MAFSGKEILLDQLAACQDDESWFAPLSIALADLTAAQAAWNEPGSHSIWQIVDHLAFYNERWLRRFQGGTIPAGGVVNAETFGRAEQRGDEAAWKAAVARLNEGLTGWRSAIADCSESNLQASIPAFPADAKWWGVISNLCTHNVYHIGQIVYIRKRQGSWKPREE